jgi:hypothetical protein
MKMPSQSDAPERSRGQDIASASGIAILIGLMLVMVTHHPIAGQADAVELVESIARQAAPNQVVHGTLAAAMIVMTSIMLGFAARLGLGRPHVLLGAVASALALVLICLSVLLDGFVAPALAVRCVDLYATCAIEAQALLRFSGLQIEFMTRVGLLLLASATVVWAAELFRWNGGARLAGALGMLSAIVQLAILVGGAERLNPHNLGLVVAAQAIWYLSVAAIIVSRQGPYLADRQSIGSVSPSQ